MLYRGYVRLQSLEGQVLVIVDSSLTARLSDGLDLLLFGFYDRRLAATSGSRDQERQRCNRNPPSFLTPPPRTSGGS